MDPELGNEIKVSISNDFTREIVFEPYRLRSRVQMQGAAADVSRMFISSSPATQTGPQKPRKASDTGPSARSQAHEVEPPSRSQIGAVSRGGWRGGDLEATNPMLMDPSKSPKGGPLLHSSNRRVIFRHLLRGWCVSMPRRNRRGMHRMGPMRRKKRFTSTESSEHFSGENPCFYYALRNRFNLSGLRAFNFV